MRIVWLLALVACVVFTAIFCWTLLYYFLHHALTWRIIGLISLVAFWTLLTRNVFLKFMGRTPS